MAFRALRNWKKNRTVVNATASTSAMGSARYTPKGTCFSMISVCGILYEVRHDIDQGDEQNEFAYHRHDH